MRRYLLLGPALALLSACSTPTAHLPSAPVPVTWPATTTMPDTGRVWWTEGSDAMLLNLVATADMHSHEIAIARARLQEARAAHVTARSLLFPDVAAADVAQRGDIDAFCIHQGSAATVDAVARRFEDKPEKFIKDMVETGNTVSSSIPLLLEKHVLDSNWRRVALSGFGVGLSWGSAIIYRP